jgi:hypothetical protein
VNRDLDVLYPLALFKILIVGATFFFIGQGGLIGFVLSSEYEFVGFIDGDVVESRPDTCSCREGPLLKEF